ncbi:MAG: hypothetical protein AAF682_11565 [Planctomycetota bacterium]
MLWKPLLGGLTLGILVPLGLSASAPDFEQPIEPSEGSCEGCVGGGGGNSEFTGPGGDLYLRVNMDKPTDGFCFGPFDIFGEFCLELPCSYSATACWKIPDGKTGKRTITGQPDLELTGID